MKRISRGRSVVAAAVVAAVAVFVVFAAFSAVPEVFEEMVPMRDGVKLYTCGSRPRGNKKMAVAILRTPYAEEQPMSKATMLATAVPAFLRGYLCVMQHCRGSGMSEGEFRPFEREREDGLDMLAWIRRQPWYNGEIFLVGGSYHSSAHWAYLGDNPPDVKGAVLPIMDVDRYNADFRNGVFKIGLFGDWSKLVYMRKDKTLKRDESAKLTDFPLSDWVQRYFGVEERSFMNVISHPRRDDPFWRSPEPGSGAGYRRAFLDSKIPVLLVTGAYDPFCEGMCEMWRETPRERTANCALLIDAYDHDGRRRAELKGTKGDFPGGERMSNPMKFLDWFDYCRTGKPCDFAPPGKVRSYVLWENRWIETDSLPEGNTRVDLCVGEGTRSWTYDPKRPLPEFPGSGGLCFGGMLPQPEPGFRDDVVSFLLPPVEKRLDVRGSMEASLCVSSDCDDTCFYVRVSVDKGDGRWYLLRDDITTLGADGADYTPGAWKNVSYRFPAFAFRLEKGDRLRVDVASACSQFAPHGNVKGNQSFVREPKTARNSINASKSRLGLFVD